MTRLQLFAIAALGPALVAAVSLRTAISDFNANDESLAAAQQSDNATPVRLAPGTPLNAELTKSIDSKKAKAGDAVNAETTVSLQSTDGRVVIPKSTKLEGHVVRSSARSKGDPDSTLAIQFDRAILKDGQQFPLQVQLVAMAEEPQSVAAVGGDDLQPAGGGIAGPGGAPGISPGGNRGTTPSGSSYPVGGASSGAASTTPRTEDQIASPGNASAQSGVTSTGELKPASRGVYGLKGLSLNAAASGAERETVIVASGKNVHLDSGTRLLLLAQAESSTSAQR